MEISMWLGETIESYIFETKLWKITYFKNHPAKTKINIVEPDPAPEEIRKHQDKNWRKILLNKKKDRDANAKARGDKRVKHIIKESGGKKALFKQEGKETCVMWNGPTICMKNFRIVGNTLVLDIYQSDFKTTEASRTRKYHEIYEKLGIKAPSADLAQCTVPQTKNGELIMTVRGGETPKYAYLDHGVGSSPRTLDFDCEKESLKEMSEELGLDSDSEWLKKYEILGIAEDKIFQGIYEGVKTSGKPDIVARAVIDKTYRDVWNIYETKETEGKQCQDVSNIRKINPANIKLASYVTPEELKREITKHVFSYSPPGSAALAMTGFAIYIEQYGKEFALEWMEDVIRGVDASLSGTGLKRYLANAFPDRS